MMSPGSAGGSMEMVNERHWDKFIKVDGIFKKIKELIFIVIKFILATGKKNLPKKAICMDAVNYGIN